MTERTSEENSKPKFLGLSKRMLFLVIMSVAASIAGVISLFAFALIDRSIEHEIRIAVVAPLSGPDQALGTAIHRGVAQYVDQVNRTGGLGGQPLRLLVLDDGGDAGKAREAARA